MIDKVETMQKIQDQGIIAVIRNVPPKKVPDLAQALINGGINILEITVDHKDAYAMIEYLAEQYRGRVLVGAGTVVDAASAQHAISRGVQFILSPHLNREIVKASLRYGKTVIPGVMTPTEMLYAMECGADLVKLFPADVVGTTFIKHMKGPFPHIPLVVTGGVDVNNAGIFIEAGAEAVGAGGSLINQQAIMHSDFISIQDTALQFVNAVRKAKAKIAPM